MRTTEKFRRKDFGHMEIEFTFNDPVAYTKPWSVTVPFELLPDTDLIENICENEKDYRGGHQGEVGPPRAERAVVAN